MATKWTWLSGFASDLSVWEDDFASAAPDAEHTFISYADVVKHFKDPFAAFPGLAAADVVVGWDIGALSLLRSQAARPAGQKWILLAPPVNFCHPQNGWPRKNVLMMSREVLKNPRDVVENCFEYMGPCEESIHDEWLEHSVKVPADLLSKSFEYLADSTFEEPVPVNDTDVYFGKEDEWVSPALAESIKAVLPGATFHDRLRSGHCAQTLLF